MIYFISDVHLGHEPRPQDKLREDKLLAFLQSIKHDCDTLVIAGDLFDFWFEYTTVVPKYYYRTLTALHEMKQSGIEIVYLMGNHDFGHKSFFEEELGIKIYRDDVECLLAGKRFYLSHGDGKSYNDTGYKLLKKIMRNPIALWIYCKFHPDWGIWLAHGSSKKSRQYTAEKNYGESDGMKDFAKAKLEQGFDFVIMGHRHKAEKIQYGKGYYINLGEWLRKPTYGTFNGEEFELKRYEE